MVQSGLPEEWCDCDGLVQLPAELARQYGHGQDIVGEYIDVNTFDGKVIPLGAKISYKPISSKDLPRLHQFGQVAAWNVHGLCFSRGEQGGLAHSRVR